MGDTEQQDEFNLRMSMVKSVLWSLLGGDNWLEMAAFFCGHGIKVFSGGKTPGRIDGMVERKAHTLATTVKTRVAQAAVIRAAYACMHAVGAPRPRCHWVPQCSMRCQTPLLSPLPTPSAAMQAGGAAYVLLREPQNCL
eukprot:SAG25_NODE_1957_length_2100_cov_1.393803_1_plen_139_part_00